MENPLTITSLEHGVRRSANFLFAAENVEGKLSVENFYDVRFSLFLFVNNREIIVIPFHTYALLKKKQRW